MGMSIDEAIYCMKSYLPSDEYTHCTECKYYGCKDNGTCVSNEAHQMAIDTMHKYQQIRQIAFPLQFCSTDKLEHEAIMKICEVLKDGND